LPTGGWPRAKEHDPRRGACPAQDRGEHIPHPRTLQGAALDAMRASHAKAYAPWSKDEDLDLKRLHRAGETIDAIASDFGRKPAAIRSRLKKHGLV
jgi:hypothetical protein